MIKELETIVKNWDLIAQPIQLIARSRGTEHLISTDIFRRLRELSLTLTNDYFFIEASQQLTQILQEVFAEDDRIIETTQEDSIALDDLKSARDEAIKKNKEEG